MNEQRFPRPFLSGSALKMIAVITMLIDHIAAYLAPCFRSFFGYSFGTLLGHKLTVYYLMRTIGRTAFPIFCFLIVEGYLHTRSRFRYGCTLLIGAMISELPWNYVHAGTWHYERQNVFFTLFLGVVAIYLYERLSARMLWRALAILGVLAFSYVLAADYRIGGVGFILLLYVLRSDLLTQSVLGILLLGPRTLPAYLAVALYNGERGFIKGAAVKYAFYLFYPAHLLVLYLIRCALL